MERCSNNLYWEIENRKGGHFGVTDTKIPKKKLIKYHNSELIIEKIPVACKNEESLKPQYNRPKHVQTTLYVLHADLPCQGPRSNFETGGTVSDSTLRGGGGGGTRQFLLLTLYNYKNIGWGWGGRAPPPPCSAVPACSGEFEGKSFFCCLLKTRVTTKSRIPTHVNQNTRTSLLKRVTYVI